MKFTFTLILTPDETDQQESLWKEIAKEAGQFIGRFLKLMDPTPVNNVNEHFIEHRVRMREAREKYSNPESSHGIEYSSVSVQFIIMK